VLRFVFNALDTFPPLLLLGYAFVRARVAWRTDWVFWFVVAQCVFNGLATTTQLMGTTNNLYLYHINCVVSFVLLSGFFRQVLRPVRLKQAIGWVLLLFLTFFVINLLYWENISTFNSNTLGLASLILIVYCLLYYLDKLTHPATDNITKSTHFWYVTGLFTYYVSSFFIFVTYRTLTQQQISNLGFLWRIHNVVFLIMCGYFLIGMICKPSQEKYKL